MSETYINSISKGVGQPCMSVGALPVKVGKGHRDKDLRERAPSLGLPELHIC